MKEFDAISLECNMKPKLYKDVYVIRKQPYLKEGDKVLSKWALLWYAIKELLEGLK